MTDHLTRMISPKQVRQLAGVRCCSRQLHADKAVSHSPAWSKPHSRRAVALETTANLFEEAEAAISELSKSAKPK
jgi:hypothetical protein